MHILYSSPQGVTFSVTGAGASIVNDAAALTDGLPDQATRFTFVTGAQTTASVLKIQCVFSASQAIGGGGIFSTTLPAGTLITIKGKRSADSGYTYDLGGNSQTQIVVSRDSDSNNVCIWQFADGIDPIAAYEISIFNNVNGTASIVAGAFFDIGEIIAAPRFYLDIDTGWTDDLAGNLNGRSTKTLQPWPTLFPPGRILTCARTLIPYDMAYGTPAPNLDQLRNLISQAQLCMVTLYAGDGTADYDKVQQKTMLALCTKFAPIKHDTGPNYSTSFVFNEIPG